MQLLRYAFTLQSILLAAGCGKLAYGDFVEEQEALHCEIQEACGSEFMFCSNTTSTLTDCEWFQPLRGERCLDEVAEVLDVAEPGAPVCEAWQSAENPLGACEFEAVTRRRRGFGCFVSRLGGSGRPLREAGVPVLAPTKFTHLSASRPHRAAARWLRNAQFEHASIAAFSRVATELMAVGAPLSLVERCHQAALDEVRHTRAALCIAEALLGETASLGALPSKGVPPRPLREIAREALLDGCCGEGAAAQHAWHGATAAAPEIALALERIAEDETRHAVLAWATVRWATERDPSMLPWLARALSEHRGKVCARQHDAADDEGDELTHFGLLSDATSTQLELEAIDALVAPTFRSLHAAARTSRASPEAVQPTHRC